MTKRSITQQRTVNPGSYSASVNSLKWQFLKDMELAGMVRQTRISYLYAVEHLVKYYWCSPAKLSTAQTTCTQPITSNTRLYLKKLRTSENTPGSNATQRAISFGLPKYPI